MLPEASEVGRVVEAHDGVRDAEVVLAQAGVVWQGEVVGGEVPVEVGEGLGQVVRERAPVRVVF